MTKFVTCHRQIPSKIEPRLFTSYFNRANDRVKLIIKVEEKSYCPSIPMIFHHG